MIKDRRQAGFSLTETLLAVGTLAIGMMFISGTFLTGVFFSTTSTERTVAAVAADEAFAKIRLDGLDPNSSGLKTDGFVLYEPLAGGPADQTHLYPSTGLEPQKQYSWSALVPADEQRAAAASCSVRSSSAARPPGPATGSARTGPTGRSWRRPTFPSRCGSISCRMPPGQHAGRCLAEGCGPRRRDR